MHPKCWASHQACVDQQRYEQERRGGRYDQRVTASETLLQALRTQCAVDPGNTRTLRHLCAAARCWCLDSGSSNAELTVRKNCSFSCIWPLYFENSLMALSLQCFDGQKSGGGSQLAWDPSFDSVPSHSLQSRLCTPTLHSRLCILALSALSSLHSRALCTLPLHSQTVLSSCAVLSSCLCSLPRLCALVFSVLSTLHSRRCTLDSAFSHSLCTLGPLLSPLLSQTVFSPCTVLPPLCTLCTLDSALSHSLHCESKGSRVQRECRTDVTPL